MTQEPSFTGLVGVGVADTEIELELGAGAQPGEYRVRVLRAASGGEPEGRLRLDVDDLRSRRRRLEETVLLSAVRPRGGVVPEIEQPLRQTGQELFEALFSGPVAEVYRASLAVAGERGRRLRVVLRLTAPELSVLPWEALFDSTIEAYLCRKEPLVRHVPAPFSPEPLPVQPPLRILGLIASPRGLPELDVETEQQHLQDALAGSVRARRVELEWLEQASWDDVHDRLLAGQWHVLHFIGHGDYDPMTDEGKLALVGADGRTDWVEASRLTDLLGAADPTPRLVVLNSCSSGQGGSRDLFSGTAATLVRSGISAVAAMQFSVSDRAAIAFPHGFYAALAAGRGVDEAVRNGRIAILRMPGTLEWVTPVLYLRGNATQLFALASEREQYVRPERQTTSAGLPPTCPEPALTPRLPRSDHLQLVVFSFNTDLMGTESLLYEVTRDLISEYSDLHRKISLNSYAAYVGLGELNFFSEMVKRYQIRGKTPAELVSEREKRYLARLQISNPGDLVKPGFRSTLELLARRNVKMAICSSTSNARVWTTLEWAGVSDYFVTCVTPDMGTAPKPSPEMLRFLLRQPDVNVQPEDCLVVESSPSGVQASVAAGCFTIVLANKFTAPVSSQHGVEVVYSPLALCKWFEDFFKVNHRSR